MANVNAPQGFKLVGHLSGTDSAPALQTCFIPATDGGSYFVGDVVVTAQSSSTSDTLNAGRGCPIIARATTAEIIKGVIVSVLPSESAPNVSITKTHRAASTAQYVEVCIDPFALFEVQAHGSTLTATKGVGLNADTSIGTGSTVTGTSGDELLDSGVAVTSTLQWKIHSFVNAPDNAIGANVRVLVSMNASELMVGPTSLAGSS
jgi:hypothetical protein